MKIILRDEKSKKTSRKWQQYRVSSQTSLTFQLEILSNGGWTIHSILHDSPPAYSYRDESWTIFCYRDTPVEPMTGVDWRIHTNALTNSLTSPSNFVVGGLI